MEVIMKCLCGKTEVDMNNVLAKVYEFARNHGIHVAIVHEKCPICGYIVLHIKWNKNVPEVNGVELGDRYDY
jgi:hypothetical protein